MAKKKEELIIIGKEEPKARPVPLPEPAAPKLSFDAWWLITQNRLKLPSHMKESVRKHMQSRGFMESGRFDDGLRDFGILS